MSGRRNSGSSDAAPKRRGRPPKAVAVKRIAAEAAAAVAPVRQKRKYTRRAPLVSDIRKQQAKPLPPIAPPSDAGSSLSASDPLPPRALTLPESSVPPEHLENWKVLSKFRPTAYLMRQEDGGQGPIWKHTTANPSDGNDRTGRGSGASPKPAASPMRLGARRLHGVEVPIVPVANVCSACQRRTDLGVDESENPILLCDGCDREYHLRCLRPRLALVPDGDFFCWDCTPTGTTAGLKRYLAQVDQGRVRYPSRTTYIAALRAHLLDPRAAEPRKRGGGAGAAVEAAVLGAELELDYIQKIERAIDLEGGYQGEEDSPGAPARAAAVKDETTAVGPTIMIGKPVELFFNDALEGERFHTGRIVDCRETTEPGIVEYLVRFSAGTDYRKTPLSAWMVLEEHIVTVGIDIVWIEERKGQWTPAIIQLRSVLALILLQQTLNPVGDTNIPPRHSYASQSPKRRERVSAWTKTFGHAPGLIERDVKSQVMRFEPDGSGQLSQLASVEWHEQQRVRDWWRMKQIQGFGYRVLTSRDEYELEPLVPVNQQSKGNLQAHAELCPLVARGLDRQHLVQLMRRRGGMAPNTKDVASTLSCKIVSMSSTLDDNENSM